MCSAVSPPKVAWDLLPSSPRRPCSRTPQLLLLPIPVATVLPIKAHLPKRVRCVLEHDQLSPSSSFHHRSQFSLPISLSLSLCFRWGRSTMQTWHCALVADPSHVARTILSLSTGPSQTWVRLGPVRLNLSSAGCRRPPFGSALCDHHTSIQVPHHCSLIYVIFLTVNPVISHRFKMTGFLLIAYRFNTTHPGFRYFSGVLPYHGWSTQQKLAPSLSTAHPVLLY